MSPEGTAAAPETWIGRLPDRQVMTGQILPGLAATRPEAILFVGCKPYTRRYSDFFDAATAYWTLDYDPLAAAWGAPDRHIVADVREVDAHFPERSLDAVLLNGVFGWGVDDAPGMERTLRGLARILRPEGTLLIGWNQGRCPDPLELPALAEAFVPAPLFGLEPRTDLGGPFAHVYDALRRA